LQIRGLFPVANQAKPQGADQPWAGQERYVFSLAIDFSSVGQDAGWKPAIRAGETPATKGVLHG
jgi:hypothetical protein